MAPDAFRLDRTQFSVARLTDPDDAVAYWLSRPVEERLRALELLRRTSMAIPALARDFKEFLKSLNSNEPAIRRRFMKNQSLDDNDMPAEIDFSKGVRGLHHIPPGAKVLMPVSIERSVWEYLSGKAEQRGVDLSELVTEVLKRDIEINEALK
jgi:hypothetical protein